MSDNGPGIPDDLLANLFEPFATLGKPSGTGFGLAIVRQIARAHGGDVMLEPSDTGTCFCIRVPT